MGGHIRPLSLRESVTYVEQAREWAAWSASPPETLKKQQANRSPRRRRLWSLPVLSNQMDRARFQVRSRTESSPEFCFCPGLPLLEPGRGDPGGASRVWRQRPASTQSAAVDVYKPDRIQESCGFFERMQLFFERFRQSRVVGAHDDGKHYVRLGTR